MATDIRSQEIQFKERENTLCNLNKKAHSGFGLMASDIRSEEIQFKERKKTGNTFCNLNKNHGGFGRMASDMRAALPAGRP